MKYLKIIIPILLVILVAGGGFAAYTVYQDDQIAKAKAEAKAEAEAEAFAQQQAAEQALAAKTKCVDTDAFNVVTFDRDGSVGQDILLRAKSEGQACKYDSAGAVFEIKNSDPEYYKFQAANALVTDVGTGPSGRSIRLYDLTDKQMITEKKYFGELKLDDTSLIYSGEAKSKADSKNCKDFKKITDDGMTPVLVVEKTIDLKSYSVKEAKTTSCVATQ